MLQATPHAAPSDPQHWARLSAQALNATAHSGMARLTGGLSPVALSLAFGDWALNLLTSPGTHAWLLGTAQQRAIDALTPPAPAFAADGPADAAAATGAAGGAAHGAANGAASAAATGAATGAGSAPAAPVPGDARFADAAWQRWPYQPLARGYAAWEQWCREAARLPGMAPHHADMVGFFTRQWLDMLAPSNWPLSPEVAQAVAGSGGQNLLRGASHFMDDWRRLHGLTPLHDDTSGFEVGSDVAATPGEVVYRNHLIELIQYAPTTPTVQAEPVFIVPSWIMKYYILDLSPHNSMVRWLVGQGHTVFIVSWRNPDADDAHLGMDDYLHLGVFDPLAAIAQRLPGVAVHAAGYCLGGTLLAIAAAALSRPGRVAHAEELPELRTVSLLAAQVDFSEPGEIGVLIDAAQVKWLEDLMAEQGYLSGRQMAGSFQFLHSRELVWSRAVREYLLGEREHPNDLMAWNADLTRMPATMHSEYLNSLFMRNELAEGRYTVEGRAVSMMDLRMPLFAVGTERDHVCPWPSVYKLHRLTETEITFALTNGGHNAGIVSEPGHPRRSYRLHTSAGTAPWLTPQDWLGSAARHEGSWWTAWQQWLAAHSSGELPARQIDPADSLAPAPGEYVRVRYAD